MQPPRQHSVALDGMMEGASYAVASQEFTDSLGYVVGVLAGGGSVGYVLGLLGGGGSILALPIFLYIFQEPASTAIAESLLVRYSWFKLVDADSQYSLNRCFYNKFTIVILAALQNAAAFCNKEKIVNRPPHLNK